MTGKDLPNPLKIFFSLVITTVSILTPTQYNIQYFDYNNCQSVIGPLLGLIYAFEIGSVFILWFLALAEKMFYKREDRKKILTVLVGITLLMGIFAASNLIGEFTQDYQFNLIGPIGIAIFIATVSFLIVRFKMFNIKLAGAQVLVVSLISLIGSKLFTAETGTNQKITFATLVFVIVFGYFLIKSVKKEIETRERIEALADQLEKANERLRVLDQQKSQFVSIASHQLRAPLTAIKGYLSMVLEGDYGKLTTPLRETVVKVFESTNNLVTIVGDFLDVSRIEQGRMVYDWKDFDLKSLVETVADEQRQPAEKKGLEFALSIEEGKTYMLHGDMNKLKQVFTNLVDNSIKYTPKGKVEISLSKPSAETIRFQVKDNGVGIDKATLPRLFEKFTRAENASEVNVIGTGLGLFVAKEMVKAHNGKVWAESAGKGLGSTFIVELAALK